jgi:hypothetical protein
MLPFCSETLRKQNNYKSKTLWSTIQESHSITEAVCKILLRKDVISPVLYTFNHKCETIPSKYMLLKHFIHHQDHLCWDHIAKTSVCFGIFDKIYFICYNLFHYLFCGSKRYENEKEFILMKLLETIHLEDSFKDKDFLEISYDLKVKISKLLKIHPSLNYQILARQVIQKIEAVHKLYNELSLCEQTKIYKGIPPYKALDLTFMTEKVSQDGLSLQYCPSFQKNKALVKKAFIQNPESLQFADATLKEDSSFIEELLLIHEKAFDHASSKLKVKPEIIKKLLKKNGLRISEFSEDIQRSEEYLLHAIESPTFHVRLLASFNTHINIMLKAYSHGAPLKIIDPCLNENRLFIIPAIQLRGWDVYVRAHPKLREDPEIKLLGYKKRFMKKRFHKDEIETLIKTFPEIFDDEEFMLHLVSIKTEFLAYGSKRLQTFPSIILKVIETDPLFIPSLEASLAKDKDFMLKVVQINGTLIRLADEPLKNEPLLIEEALKQNPMSVAYLPEELVRQSSFIKNFLISYPDSYDLLDLRHLRDEDALLVLENQGLLFVHMPDKIKHSLEHIRMALRSAPQLIASISTKILKENPEFSQLYLIKQLPAKHVMIKGHYYLPLPLPELKLSNEPVIESQEDFNFELFYGQTDSDLSSFIDELNLASAKSLKINASTEAMLLEIKGDFRNTLQTFNHRFKDQIAFTGTPRSQDKDKLKLFYESCRYYLKGIGVALMPDKSLKKERLQLLEAMGVCGGGWLGNFHELNLGLCTMKSTNLYEHIWHKLSQIARARLALLNPSQDVHDSNMLHWYLHPYLGGPKIILDPLGDEIDEMELLIDFFSHYSCVNIAKELAQDLEHDELFHELCEEHVNSELLPRFKTHDAVLEELDQKKSQLFELLKVFEASKLELQQKLDFLSDMSNQHLMTALNILFRPGGEMAVFKTLEMYLKPHTSLALIHRFYTMRPHVESLYRYFSTIQALSGVTKTALLDLSPEEILESSEQYEDQLQEMIAQEEFSKNYRTKNSTLSYLGILEILIGFKFVQKVV